MKVFRNDKRSQIFTLSRYAGILRRCLKENAMSAQKPGLHPRFHEGVSIIKEISSAGYEFLDNFEMTMQGYITEALFSLNGASVWVK